jgi:hypothetical protein
MNYKKSILGSVIAFVLATSCCWLPALIVVLGGASSMLAIAKGIEQFGGVFIAMGVLLLLYGAYLYYKKMIGAKISTRIQLLSSITCPECGHTKEEIMPKNACQYFYECENCRTVLKPEKGDCCVYCSYGTVTCPPIQQGQNCCK